MKILVTGAAGFIGFHTVQGLIERGHDVVGLDSLNDYYDVNLKIARLENLSSHSEAKNFHFEKLDLCEQPLLKRMFQKWNFDVVINLAAQAGVRYSLVNPHAYLKSNVDGFLNILECAREFKIKNLIYASSSSVYGLNSKLPFSELDNVDHPISLYAATKKSNELMAHTYSHLFNIPTTGLRFFTVYGPWGRPDMAMFKFCEAILEGKPISLYNAGNMERDFTYISDVVESLVRLCSKPAEAKPLLVPADFTPTSSNAPYQVFNIGNNKPVFVKDVLAIIERYLGKKALVIDEPIQPGDVRATFASTEKLSEAVDFRPKTPIEQGIRNLLDWLLLYKGHAPLERESSL